MTIPEAAPTPAPTAAPRIAQVPHERGCSRYAQPLKPDANSAMPATAANAFNSLDFNLMNSSSPKRVYSEANASPCPRASAVSKPELYPPQLTGKYSYIRNKNATRPGLNG